MWWCAPAIPATQGSTNRMTEVEVQASPGMKQDPISKKLKQKRAGDHGSVVQYLPNKVLSSNPSNAKKKKKP
jgi:hypothetical protein